MATLEAYDPMSNSWSLGPEMAEGPRQWLAAAAVNGVLYAIGGMDEAGAYLSRVEAYDPATDAWTPKTPMTVARRFLGAGVVDGILYAVGGDNAAGPLTTVEAFDPTAGPPGLDGNPVGAWTTKAPLPQARTLVSVATVDGVLYAIGGSHGSISSSVFAYDPATDSWMQKGSMPTSRGELAAGVIDGRVYAVGGLRNTGFPGVVTPRLESYIDLVWGTSDAAVATVTQNGQAAGRAEGTATIAARVGPVTCLAGIPSACAEVVVSTGVEAPAIDDLIDQVSQLPLPRGLELALLATLRIAAAAIDRGLDGVAQLALYSFARQVHALKVAGKLPAMAADDLIDQALALAAGL